MPDTPTNKVKFGLKSAYYAVATIANDGSATFGTPKPLPGAVSLSLDPQGDNSAFRADNMDYYTSNGSNGYSGNLELALLPDDFRKDVLGEAVAGNGVQYEELRPPVVHFALLFQIEGDVKAARHTMYNCTATRPSVGSSTTESGAVTPVTDTLNISASSVYVSALEKDIVKGKVQQGDSAYSDWFSAVTLPAATSSGSSGGAEGSGGTEGTGTGN